jgi:hypothetical protein
MLLRILEVAGSNLSWYVLDILTVFVILFTSQDYSWEVSLKQATAVCSSFFTISKHTDIN